MARSRLILYMLALLAILGLGSLGGLLLARFTLAGANPFYWNAPLPAPLVAVPEPGPAAEAPSPDAAPPPEWAYHEERIDRLGYDPGPPDPARDDDPAPPPEALLVIDRPLPDAPRATVAAPSATAPVAVVQPPPPVAVTQATAAPR